MSSNLNQLMPSATGLVFGALSQIQAGLAWHFLRYAAEQAPDERERYALAEREARQSRRGLWADPHPQAPWTFRQRNRG